MKEALKTFLRSAQTRFPWMLEQKFNAQRLYRRTLRKPFDPDFRLLSALPVPEGTEWLDIGSNRGQSIDAMRIYKPDVKIVAFEPNRFLSDRLNKLFETDSALDIHNLGLGQAEGEFTLYIPMYGKWVFDGLASFDAESAMGWLRTRMIGFDPNKLSVQKIVCKVRTLDSMRLRPSFIKVDVQGLEEQVLEGGRETLKRTLPTVLLEWNEPRPPAILAELGYIPCAMEASRLRVGQTGEINTFFFQEDTIQTLDSSRICVST